MAAPGTKPGRSQGHDRPLAGCGPEWAHLEAWNVCSAPAFGSGAPPVSTACRAPHEHNLASQAHRGVCAQICAVGPVPSRRSKPGELPVHMTYIDDKITLFGKDSARLVGRQQPCPALTCPLRTLPGRDGVVKGMGMHVVKSGLLGRIRGGCTLRCWDSASGPPTSLDEFVQARRPDSNRDVGSLTGPPSAGTAAAPRLGGGVLSKRAGRAIGPPWSGS